MADASRRAARATRRGGLSNALFLAGDAAQLPTALRGRVDEFRVVLPWGSLLLGVSGPEAWFVDLLAGALAPSGRAALLLSVTEHERATGLAPLDAASVSGLAARYGAAGLGVCAARPATGSDLEELDSSWARRLGIPWRRVAWRLDLARADCGNKASRGTVMTVDNC
jgi:hypothetical protein